jgi:hypothetical protein
VVYADDVNLLWENINTMKGNMEAVTGTSKDVGLKVNVENTGQSYNLKTG